MICNGGPNVFITEYLKLINSWSEVNRAYLEFMAQYWTIMYKTKNNESDSD
jgi:hypothetical protein